jgi:hypothetical protein
MLVADRQHVAEALGGDERRRRALALDQGVGDDRRRVNDDAVDIAGRDAGLIENPVDAAEEALQQVVMGRQRLVDRQRARRRAAPRR